MVSLVFYTMRARLERGDLLRVGHRDVPRVVVAGILEQVAVEAGLPGGEGVGGVDLLPVLGPGAQAGDPVGEGGLLVALGDELVDEDAAEEDPNGVQGARLEIESIALAYQYPVYPQSMPRRPCVVAAWTGDGQGQDGCITPNDSVTSWSLWWWWASEA
jgi:hypothetical protein